MTNTIPATEPNELEQRAHRSRAVARAWQQGAQLGRLLTEHDVARPERVFSDSVDYRPGRRLNSTDVYASMANPADLLRLAFCTRAEVHVCDRSPYTGREQMYLYLGADPQRQIVVYWAGQPTPTGGVVGGAL